MKLLLCIETGNQTRSGCTRLDFPNQCRKSAMQCVMVLLIGFTGVTVAQTPVNSPDNATTDLVIIDDKASKFQLEVRQMPLAQVLDTISGKTQIPIHYSVLPQGLASATCVGKTLEQVLECLLDRKADLIVRYSRSTANADSKGLVAEAWILGSKLDDSPATAYCIATAGGMADKRLLTLMQDEKVTEAEPDRTDNLLKMTQSKNPAERAEALGSLMANGRKGDPDVKAALEKALSDQDANVRAQAISSLSHREGSGAAGAIQEALHDSAVDVRLMAVDGITDDVALLQQAINDSDETVRSLAAVKLEELTQGNKAKP